MSRYQLGQKVRITLAYTADGKKLVGREGVITEIDLTWIKDAYGLDIAPIIYEGDFSYAWGNHQLAPAIDSYDKTEWKDCAWKPDHMREVA